MSNGFLNGKRQLASIVSPKKYQSSASETSLHSLDPRPLNFPEECEVQWTGRGDRGTPRSFKVTKDREEGGRRTRREKTDALVFVEKRSAWWHNCSLGKWEKRLMQGGKHRKHFGEYLKENRAKTLPEENKRETLFTKWPKKVFALCRDKSKTSTKRPGTSSTREKVYFLSDVDYHTAEGDH